MNNINIKNLEESIRNASPLELTNLLQQAELYDAKETKKVIDEIYEEFNSKNDLINKILIPIFTSVIDGIMESSAATRSMRKKGLTASRIVVECQNFEYDSSIIPSINYSAYTEYKNAREYTNDYGNNVRTPYKGNRKVYDDDSKKYYKKRAFMNNEGRKNAVDEYTGERNIYDEQKNPDLRRNDPKHRYQAQADHIVPLKEVHKYLKGNYALSNEDITRIANSDDNMALTAAYINQGVKGKGGKNDMTNKEFVEDQNKREREGRDNLGLSEETKQRMIQKERDANKSIDKQVNETVKNNIFGKGISVKESQKAYEKEKERLGRTLTQEEMDMIDKNIARNIQNNIAKTTAKNALDQSTDYMIGNLLLFIIKPLYYEMSDIFSYGLIDGVNANSVTEAFKIRFSRLKNYVICNARNFIGSNLGDFIKGFISSLIEGIISLFVGIFKQILKLIKEGIKVFIQAGKVLFGKNASQMSAAEKGDAIIKILGGTVISVCGIGIEALINKLGFGEPWSIVFSTMLTGIASALFMFTLDKMDLFSVKDEKRLARINDIFNERIKDIEDARNTMNTIVIETMRKQHLEFSTINEVLKIGIDSNNIDKINDELYCMAKIFDTHIPYKDNNEFCEYFDKQELTL